MLGLAAQLGDLVVLGSEPGQGLSAEVGEVADRVGRLGDALFQRGDLVLEPGDLSVVGSGRSPACWSAWSRSNSASSCA